MKQSIKIHQCDKRWNVVREYDSVAEAAEAMDVSRQSIDRAIREGKRCGGFNWEKVRAHEKSNVRSV